MRKLNNSWRELAESRPISQKDKNSECLNSWKVIPAVPVAAHTYNMSMTSRISK